jgi:ABC-type multidrug transport system ATPase subunit
MNHNVTVVQVFGLGKRYGHRWLFRNVEMTINSGDSLLVSGKNGAGKTTFLRCLAGLEISTEGSVVLGGSAGLAALDQSVFSALTVREHVLLAAKLKAAPLCGQELAAFGLESHQNTLCGQLSSGLRSRLKLLCAMLGDPAILFLDEPGAAMDAEGQALVEQIVAQQRKRGALIFASNDATERRFATHEVCL